jgi:hypothetical protein
MGGQNLGWWPTEHILNILQNWQIDLGKAGLIYVLFRYILMIRAFYQPHKASVRMAYIPSPPLKKIDIPVHQLARLETSPLWTHPCIQCRHMSQFAHFQSVFFSLTHKVHESLASPWCLRIYSRWRWSLTSFHLKNHLKKEFCLPNVFC